MECLTWSLVFTTGADRCGSGAPVGAERIRVRCLLPTRSVCALSARAMNGCLVGL